MFELKEYRPAQLSEADAIKLNKRIGDYKSRLVKYEDRIKQIASMTNGISLFPLSSEKIQKKCYDSIQRYKIILNLSSYRAGDCSVKTIFKFQILKRSIKDISRNLSEIMIGDYTSDMHDPDNLKHKDMMLSMSVRSEVHEKYAKAYKVFKKCLDKTVIDEYSVMLFDKLACDGFNNTSLVIAYRPKSSNSPINLCHLLLSFKGDIALSVTGESKEHRVLTDALEELFRKIMKKYLSQYNFVKQLELINFFLRKYLYDTSANTSIRTYSDSFKVYID